MNMNTVNRFLSKKEKNGGSHKRDKSRDKSGKKLKVSHSLSSISAAFYNPHGKSSPEARTTFFTVHATSANPRHGFFLQLRPSSTDGGILNLFKRDPQKKLDKEDKEQEGDSRIFTLKDQLEGRGYPGITDDHINYAITSAQGDLDKAFELLLTFQESAAGIIKPYDTAIPLQGAENRDMETCYLDSLLFAMTARLDSFEPMLCQSFTDEPTQRLATLLRLWVNLLRTGQLIQTDVTGYLLDALVACGWEGAKGGQQDTSEAFSFITDHLKLPLLTLKVDYFHNGKEDVDDDHKFVNERLLEIGVPEEGEGSGLVALEDLLENFFNTQVEIRRGLEKSSIRSAAQSPTGDKESYQHVEDVDLSRNTPDIPATPRTPTTPITPGGRACMLRQQDEEEKTSFQRANSFSIRKNPISMPAWQCFNLIRPLPFYFDMIPILRRPTNEKKSVLIGPTAWVVPNIPPKSDAQVARHFSEAHPVMGICLKRYGMTAGAEPTKNNTFIDIPLELKLPHFYQDHSANGASIDSFRLVLQSVVCHRGNSVHQGHYISFTRCSTQIADGDYESSKQLNSHHPPNYPKDRWMKFDDLAEPRVRYVDIEQCLKDETPYLLFYQVLPICEPSSIPDEVLPPSYDSGIGMHPSKQRRLSVPREYYFDGATGDSTPAIRLSTELDGPEEPRRSLNPIEDDRRGSIAFTEISTASTSSYQILSTPATPNEETTAQRVSRAAARITKSSSKSRPTSASGEGRLSSTIARLPWKTSREYLNRKMEHTNENVKEGATGPDFAAQSDGPTESRRQSDLIDESIENEQSSQSKLEKKNKKRDKSKGPEEKLDHEHKHHFKGKGGKDKFKDKEREKEKEKDKDKDDDRVCSAM